VAPADIVSMNGYVLNGLLHPHITLSTGDHAFGGHLEPGTNVFTFALVTLGVLDDEPDFSRLDDQTYR
jgi:predicted DNA-binding protein with PD1-like motif